MVTVLERMGCQDGRCQHGSRPHAWLLVMALNPDGNVGSQIKEDADDPVWQPHGALARRSIRVRLQQSTDPL